MNVTLVRYYLNKGVQFALCWVAFSCLEPITIKVEDLEKKIVVTGQVSNLEGRTFAQIGETNGSGRFQLRLESTTVELVDEFGNQYKLTEIIDIRNRGRFVLPGFRGTPGHSYFIRVTTPTGVFESDPETIPMQTGTEELTYDFTEGTAIDLEGVVFTSDMVRVFTKPKIPDTDPPLYIKWYLEEVYMLVPTQFPDPFGTVPAPCYITQGADPQRVVLFDGKEFSPGALDSLFIGWRVAGQTFTTRHYFNSYMGSISEAAHDYWRRVDVLTNNVGTIFDTPPAPINGNIHDVEDPTKKMLGYFQAAHESVARISLTLGDLPFTITPQCMYNPDWPRNRYPTECLDCTSARNSSRIRPPWFGE